MKTFPPFQIRCNDESLHAWEWVIDMWIIQREEQKQTWKILTTSHQNWALKHFYNKILNHTQKKWNNCSRYMSVNGICNWVVSTSFTTGLELDETDETGADNG